jgi:hypothetical protein|nr:MAG TPA: hypothetical protein [Caudoviricetes sp.]
MNWDIVVTPLLTTLSGVLVFVIGQIILECYIKPLQEYHKIKSEISFLLVLYANVYMNPEIYGENKGALYTTKEKERRIIAEKELREAAAKLIGIKQQKPLLVKKDDITEASANLIGLSNGLYSSVTNQEIQMKENELCRKKIKKSLHLK